MSVSNDRLVAVIEEISTLNLMNALLLKTGKEWFTNDQLCHFVMSISLKFKDRFHIYDRHGELHSESFENFFYSAHSAQTLECTMDCGPRYRLNPAIPNLVRSNRQFLTTERLLPKYEEEFAELGRLFLEELEKRPIGSRRAA